jgi:hypothetical protein
MITTKINHIKSEAEQLFGKEQIKYLIKHKELQKYVHVSNILKEILSEDKLTNEQKQAIYILLK